jgi:hypothetical protein
MGKADKKVWESIGVDGESLRGVTQEMLEKRGMGFSPAFKVVSEIHKLIGQPPIAVPPST